MCVQINAKHFTLPHTKQTGVSAVAVEFGDRRLPWVQWKDFLYTGEKGRAVTLNGEQATLSWGRLSWSRFVTNRKRPAQLASVLGVRISPMRNVWLSLTAASVALTAKAAALGLPGMGFRVASVW